jgi:hypothetical protein
MLHGNNNGVLNPEILYLRYRNPVSVTKHQCQCMKVLTQLYSIQHSSGRSNPGYYS